MLWRVQLWYQSTNMEKFITSTPLNPSLVVIMYKIQIWLWRHFYEFSFRSLIKKIGQHQKALTQGNVGLISTYYYFDNDSCYLFST